MSTGTGSPTSTGSSTSTVSSAGVAPTQAARVSGTGLPRIAGPRPDAPIGLGRLVGVEWRKQVDTRAGLWLLLSIGLVTAGVLVIMLFVQGGAHSWADYIMGTATPMSILVPIVGILAATSEWSQRTGLSTFALEPRRGRVVAAKALSSLLTAAVVLLLSVVVSAGVHQLAVGVRGVDPDWSMTWAVLGGITLMITISLLQGVGFGLSLLNTPGAIVAYFLLPTVWSVLGGLVPWLRDVAPWLDLGVSMDPLLSGSMTGEQWAHLSTSAAVWVAMPLLFGYWRVRRAELK